MSYRAKPMPMPENPANRAGDKSGLWCIIIEDLGTGSIIPENPRTEIFDENLSYDEALKKSSELNQKLNSTNE